MSSVSVSCVFGVCLVCVWCVFGVLRVASEGEGEGMGEGEV